MMLKGKKVLAIGERDGVPGPAIARCAQEAGAEVVMEMTHCFVWTAAGALDLEGQDAIKRVAERYNRDELMVLIGTPNSESSELVATTLTEGDPTWAGVLAGVRLELPVFHITEGNIKALVPPDVYASQVGLAEVALDTAAIAETLQQVRSRVRG